MRTMYDKVMLILVDTAQNRFQTKNKDHVYYFWLFLDHVYYSS
jgi:hypothetical protein